MSFAVLTIIENDDDYKRHYCEVMYQKIYSNQDLAELGLLSWMINYINNNELTIVSSSFLEPYILKNKTLSLKRIIKKSNDNPTECKHFIDELYPCFDGEYVQSKIAYDIQKHATDSIIESINKIIES